MRYGWNTRTEGRVSIEGGAIKKWCATPALWVRRGYTINWKPAIDFDECYLAVYSGKGTCVYISREAYELLGRPRKVVVSLKGDTISLSPARKHGTDVHFNRTKQPYIIHRLAGRAIGPGNKAYFDYDERRRDEKRRLRYFFYFLVRSTNPAPTMSPAAPARA